MLALRTIVEEKDPARRVEEGERLNRKLNSLLAYYLSHLCFEEEALVPVTHRTFTDEDIVSIQRSMQQSVPPERHTEFLRLMIPSASTHDLISFLAGAKAGAPPAALQHLVELLAQVLPPGRLHLIRDRAGV